MQILIGDKSDKNGNLSLHGFKDVDGDIYMISGKDYDKISELEKYAVERIQKRKSKESIQTIRLMLDNGEFKNRTAAKIQQEYKQKVRNHILHSENKGELGIQTDSDGFISQIVYKNGSSVVTTVANI